MEVIGIVGKRKRSGKTTTIECLVRELVKRGYKVGTVKHIPRDDFSIDKKGSDTWKHAQAGATIVVAVSKNEVVYISKTAKEESLSKVIKGISDVDYLLIEGFKTESIPKIVVALSKEDALDIIDDATILVSGPIAGKKLKSLRNTPVIDATKNADKIIDLLEKRKGKFQSVRNKLPGLNCGKCGFDSCDDIAKDILIGNASFEDCVVLGAEKGVMLEISGSEVPLGGFVQDFVKNTVLGMVSSLKKAEMKPGDVIELTIRVTEDDL
jgi:molybdopterin-guanine dinucleotide biosynthesis protein B